MIAEPAAPSRPQVMLPAWLLGLAALLLVGGVLTGLALLAGPTLPDRNGPPVEQVAVEHTVLAPGTIALTLRNTGPDLVQVAQVFVHDAYVDVTGGTRPIGRLGTETLRLDYPWQEGQPYLVSLVTSSGAVIEHEIDAAVLTPRAGPGWFGLMALLGTYVGILPVLLGMLLLPVLRRAGGNVVRVLLAVTVGLLAFLAVDGTVEGVELAAGSGGPFGGATLVVLGAARAFLLLSSFDQWLRPRRPTFPEAGFERAAAGRHDRGRHRPARPGGGPRHRLGVRRRRTHSRRGPGRRLRAAQHDRRYRRGEPAHW